MVSKAVFVTGATGYIGAHLVPILVRRGHRVRALVRSGSEQKLPAGCLPVVGEALDSRTFVNQLEDADTFVQLVGVARPNPLKADEFRRIDLVSIRESVLVARRGNIRHFVYLSVAQPAPFMKAYQAVRVEGERMIRESAMNATIIRPWYVLGPGHYWPYALTPLYWIAERISSTRDQAQRLGLVTLGQMIAALVAAVENPAIGVRIVEVKQIRSQQL